MRIYASQRLLFLKASSWFDELSDDEQKDYVEDHPNSQYAEDYDNSKDNEYNPNDNGDDERIQHVRDDINYLIDDIKEIEGDGEDASVERDHLERLREELAHLENKQGTI